MLAVSDTGIGIAPDRLEGIFKPFARPGSNQAQAGVGLGLALVRRLVELHGGTVAIDSAPGRGTTVTLTLPA